MADRLFDIAICALLILTIAHLALVQRRLRAFRAERDRLQAFVTALDLTVERAESAIRRMRPLLAQEDGSASAKPQRLRERAPEDLLKAARAAAGVQSGVKNGGAAAREAARGRSETTKRDAETNRTGAAGATAGAGDKGGSDVRRSAGRGARRLADALQDTGRG